MSAPPPIRFGTDGVRGPAGTWPITPEGADAIGQGLATWAGGDAAPRIVVIRDPRASGAALADAVCAGIARGGGVALRGGVLPTAAASCIIADLGLDAGVVLTASHNPWTDNGLKVMVRGGGKLLDPASLEACFGRAVPSGVAPGRVESLDQPAAAWHAALPDVDLAGLTVLLDAASGAGHVVAAEALRARGATVLRRDPTPDGRNINDGTGALHPPDPAEVRRAGADLAICLDGDADRVQLVDPDAGLLDGDDLLWLLGAGGSEPVVGTVMTNGGLEAALEGRLVRAPVGDRHVAEKMAEVGATIGAEPSGHVLFRDGMPTGDGLYAALRALQAVARRTGRLTPLPAGGWTRWPQVGTAVRFTGPRIDLAALHSLEGVRQSGQRAVVRYSGTEPKLRIMVEGMGTGSDAPAAHVERIAVEFRALLAAR